MLKPEVSLPVGLATAAVVYSVYSNATPPMTDIRVGEPGNDHVAKTERAATIASAGIVAGISLVAKDPTIFIVGGAMVIIMSFWTKHSNMVNPLTSAIGKVMPEPQTQQEAPADYGYAGDMAMVGY
jgi:hypothetical protein